MNNNKISNEFAKGLQLLGITVKRTSSLLNIKPIDVQIIDLGNLKDRIRYWREIGAFFGGMFGIACGFVLSCITNLGSSQLYDIVLCWVAMCLAGAILIGGLSSLCVRFLQFKFSPTTFFNPKKPADLRQDIRPVGDVR
jgi:hypothetical protein